MIGLYALKGSTYKWYTNEESALKGVPKKDENVLKEKLRIPFYSKTYGKLMD